MKIEFKKLPFTEKEFSNEFASVKLEGTFCKISSTLAKASVTLIGKTPVNCCRCGDEYDINVDEEFDFLLSDGPYTNSESDDFVFEIENSIVDFDHIIESEMSSLASDYHICEKCSQNKNDIEQKI